MPGKSNFLRVAQEKDWLGVGSLNLDKQSIR
jgi:hypothetical protein